MSLFEQILQTNIVNFLIVLSVLGFAFKKAHLGDLIEKMAQDVRASVEKSSKDATNAISEYKATKRAIKDVPKIQEEIISGAKSNAQNLKEKIEQKTLLKEEEIKNSIEKIQNSQIDKVKKMTISDIYTACIDIAQDEITSKLNDEIHKNLINKSIDELEKIEGSLL